jgi:predicted transcriptional regulator
MNTASYQRLKALGHDPLNPAVPVERSVDDDGIACLFDGVVRKDLTRHIRIKFGVSPEEYRTFWQLDDDYPMTCASLMRVGRADFPPPRVVERHVLGGHAATR